MKAKLIVAYTIQSIRLPRILVIQNQKGKKRNKTKYTIYNLKKEKTAWEVGTIQI